MSASTDTITALHASAAAHETAREASYDRCDTDGFMSQWAHGVSAAKDRLQAEIVAAGGQWTFPALFALDGSLAPAKLITTRYGTKWALFASADDVTDRSAPVIAWLPAFPARESTLAKKGYREGWVYAPARAELRGANATSVMAVAVRTDGGFDPSAREAPEMLH